MVQSVDERRVKDDRKYCGNHQPPIKPYSIRDKVYIISLFKYGEGEPAFFETIILANTSDHALFYYTKSKDKLPEHKAISIKLQGE